MSRPICPVFNALKAFTREGFDADISDSELAAEISAALERIAELEAENAEANTRLKAAGDRVGAPRGGDVAVWMADQIESMADEINGLRDHIGRIEDGSLTARIAALEADLKTANEHVASLVIPETSWHRDIGRPLWAWVELGWKDFKYHQAAAKWLEAIAERGGL